MDRSATNDPAEAVNAYAASQGWPFRGSTLLEFDRPELNLLRDIWHEKAASRPIPYRRDLDARTLKPVLRNIVILERVNDSGRVRYRVRLMGTDIARLVGETTGRFLDERVPAQPLPRWLAPFDCVMDTGLPFRFVTRYATEPINYLTSEAFVAPLLNDEGEPTMLLSCVYFQSLAQAPDPFN